jgi:hypothetical protein
MLIAVANPICLLRPVAQMWESWCHELFTNVTLYRSLYTLNYCVSSAFIGNRNPATVQFTHIWRIKVFARTIINYYDVRGVYMTVKSECWFYASWCSVASYAVTCRRNFLTPYMEDLGKIIQKWILKKPSAWCYNWDILSLRTINTGTWSSKLGFGCKPDVLAV